MSTSYQRNLYPFHHVEVDDTWLGVHSAWRAVIAEMMGTLLLVFISSAVSIASNTFTFHQPGFAHTVLLISLANGLAYTSLVFAFYHLSGGHLNPATTWGALITRRMGIMRGIAYIVAQVIGAILGALLAAAATPAAFHGRMGAHFWEQNLSNFNGFLLEAMLTFLLVLVVFATYYDPVGLGHLAPLPIGLTVLFGYLVGYVFVGTPMNPARALGTAIVYGTYDHMWVYWVGPIVGSTLAALMYTLLFISRPVAVTDYVKTSAYVTPSSPVVPVETTRLISPGVGAV